MSEFQIIKQLLEPPIAFQVIYAKIADSATAGLFLSQAFYWSSRKEDGWFYKTQKDWQKETCLTRYEQETARKKLKAIGVLEEKLKGSPAKTHYRVNIEKLVEKIKDFSLLETNKLDCGKPTNQFAGKPQTLNLKETKTTTETTTDISAGKKSGKPAAPETPKYDKRTKDERSGHKAIQFIRTLLNRYPDKILWDDIIKWFGENFDEAKLTDCRKTWISRGYNPNATTWMRWYFQGIPEQVSAAQVEAAKDKKAWQSVGKAPETIELPEEFKELLDNEEPENDFQMNRYEQFCYDEAVKGLKPDFAKFTKDFHDTKIFWQMLLETIGEKFDSHIFGAWFKPLHFAGFEHNKILIMASEVNLDWIQNYYPRAFPEAFEAIDRPDLSIEFLRVENLNKEELTAGDYFRKYLICQYQKTGWSFGEFCEYEKLAEEEKINAD